MTLEANVDIFRQFFSGLWSTEHEAFTPFPWQQALAERVLAKNEWPARLRMPTGAGKTAVLDLAVFHLATQAKKSIRARRAPLRICYVVDRRIVVDEAFERATKMASTLERSLDDENADPVLRSVATALADMGDRSLPLHVARMRGGIYREDIWATSPTQPTICISTVDQVGSRLLFRGYGVSNSMKPIHAGLLGNDALFILDEAHLSRPFEETLERIDEYRSGDWAEHPPNSPFQVVSMSATISAGDADWYTDDVRKLDLDDPVLGPRLTAQKRARLKKIKPSGDHRTQRDALAKTIAYEAVSLLEKDTEPKVIGVVVNRVRTARDVFERINSNLEEAHTILLTGRMRSVDRDRLLQRWGSEIKAGRDRETSEEIPLFVVATQTIEVGADLDFDAMVTELAALDSLRQRFGRVDRFGELGETPSVIATLHDYTLKRGSENEPIYGSSLRATWKWLKSQKEGGGKSAFVDMGIEGFELPEDEEELRQMCAPRKNAPVLLPAHLDTLVQTSPRPRPEPEVALYLHGVDSGSGDVHVVWRADLTRAMFERGEEQRCIDIVNMAPPTLPETLRLSIGATKHWLRNLPVELTDIEGVEIGNESRRSWKKQRQDEEKRILRWSGPMDSELISIDEIRPGDTIVVPSEYGGADSFGFHPQSTAPVTDVAERARFLSKKLPVLRLAPEVVRQWNVAEETKKAIESAIPHTSGDGEIEREAIDEVLEQLASGSSPVGPIAECFSRYSGDVHIIQYPHPESGRIPLAVEVPNRPTDEALRAVSMNRKPPPDTSCFDLRADDSVRRQLGLNKHLNDTARTAEAFARELFGKGRLSESLRLAARLHDIGKADPRFQTWLHEGDHIAAAAGESLAKSAMNPRDRSTWNQARKLAQFPDGYRHECLSVAMLSDHPILDREDIDAELVKYLVGTHHGRGRPFFSANSGDTDDSGDTTRFETDGERFEHTTSHRLFRLDSGWTELFWSLTRRYGYWGLAHLETILRLADHKASRQAEELDEL